MIYRIVYWTNPIEGHTWSFDANDVQWKDYGVRATNDESGERMIFPYSSIQYIKLLDENL